MAQTSASVGGRAALALALLLGFYVIALSVLALMVWMLVYMVATGDYNIRGLIAAPIIIYGITRGVFFVDKGDTDVRGVQVTDQTQPRLLQFVHEVARDMDAEPPDRVVLVPDVNAFVYQHAKLMGLKPGDRVMGIGMGLLSALRVDQLRGVIAHEMGHYAGGDTRLGPLLYRADETMRRTIRHLADGLLQRLFVAYYKLFARLTMRIRRRQELEADAMAVRLAGRDTHTSALREVGAAAMAFDFYMGNYVIPALERGVYPPELYSGFRSLLADPSRQDELAEARAAIEDQRSDPYDSHPSLAERVAHAATVPASGAPPDPRSARELLADPDATEAEVVHGWTHDMTGGQPLRALGWHDIGGHVFGRQAAENAAALMAATADVDGGSAPANLDRTLAALEQNRHAEIVAELVDSLDGLDGEERAETIRGVLQQLLVCAVATDLVENHGCRWAVSWSGPAQVLTPSGEPVDVEAAVTPAAESAAGVHHLRQWLRDFRGVPSTSSPSA